MILIDAQIIVIWLLETCITILDVDNLKYV